MRLLLGIWKEELERKEGIQEDTASDSCPPLPLSFPTNWTWTGGSKVGPCVLELGMLTSQCCAFGLLTYVLTVIFLKTAASQDKNWHFGTSYSRFYKTSPFGGLCAWCHKASNQDTWRECVRQAQGCVYDSPGDALSSGLDLNSGNLLLIVSRPASGSITNGLSVICTWGKRETDS